MAGLYEANVPMKLQELGDTIFQAESEKTPFSRLLKRGKKPVQMLSEWPCEKYPDRAFGGTLDGTDLATFESTTRQKLSAYAMWMMTKGWMVSKLAQITQSAGVKSEKAKQAADDGLILARMIERQLLSTMDCQVENGGDAYQSRGAFSWVQTSAQSQLPVPSDFRPAAACAFTSALSGFLPANMETMLAAAATAKKGAVDLTAFVGIGLKSQMSTWAQRDPDAEADEAAALQCFCLDASEKKLIHSVDTFEFDAGVVTTIPSWYLACDPTTGEATAYTPKSGLFLDMSMWELAFVQEPTAWELPTQSGGPRGYHDAIYLLKCLNPLGSCYVYTNS